MPHGAPFWPDYGDFQSAPINGHSQRPSACIKGAKPRHHRGMLLWRAIPMRACSAGPLNLRGLRHDRLQQLRKSFGSGYVR